MMDAHIQSYIRGGVRRGRKTEKVGPFLASFARRSANPYLNYAIPNEGATPTPVEVDALVAAYRSRGLRPRLEYLSSLAPAVEAVLVAGGFSVEGRLPIMVCTPGSEHDLPTPWGIELVVPDADDDLLAMLAVLSEAYGDSPPSPAEVEGRRASLEAGGLAILARDSESGKAVGGGLIDVPENQTAEVFGIGVCASFRRRGIAGALTTRLVREAFARGITTLFLTPAHDAEERIYTRAGFSKTSEQLHISLPSA